MFRLLATLACCTVFSAAFYAWTEVSALYFPERRGLTALVGVVFLTTMLHVYVIRAVRRIGQQVQELEDVTRAVLMRVVDIQQNPLVEFNLSKRKDGEPLH